MSKLIDCPIRDSMTRSDCSTARSPAFGCPVTCSHNPYNPDNYDKYGEIEELVLKKCNALQDDPSFDTSVLLEQARKVMIGLPDQAFSPHLLMSWILTRAMFERGADGQSFWEKKYKAKKHDETVVGEMFHNFYVSIIEVVGFSGPYHTQVRDAFDGSVKVMLDHRMRDGLVIGQRMLTILFPVQEHLRARGSSYEILPIFHPRLVEWVKAQATKAGISCHEYMTRNMPSVFRAQVDIYKASKNDLNEPITPPVRSPEAYLDMDDQDTTPPGCQPHDCHSIGCIYRPERVDLGSKITSGIRVLIAMDLGSLYIMHHQVIADEPRTVHLHELTQFIKTLISKNGLPTKRIMYISKTVWMSSDVLRQDAECIQNGTADIGKSSYAEINKAERLALVEWGRGIGLTIEFNGE